MILAIMLTACSSLAEAEPQIEAMLDAIASENVDAAAAQMHPNANSDEKVFAAQFTLWTSVINGQAYDEYSFRSVSVNHSGDSRTESATCKVVLKDGTKLTLKYVYVEDAAGDGFTEFRLIE